MSHPEPCEHCRRRPAVVWHKPSRLHVCHGCRQALNEGTATPTPTGEEADDG